MLALFGAAASMADCTWDNVKYSIVPASDDKFLAGCCKTIVTSSCAKVEVAAVVKTTDTTFGDKYKIKASTYADGITCDPTKPMVDSKEYEFNDHGDEHSFDETLSAPATGDSYSVGFTVTCENTASCAGVVESLKMGQKMCSTVD
jgi:hypothetical protein